MPHDADDRGDDALMDELRDALTQSADVPAGWRETAGGAFAWRTIDQELLALTYDSDVQAGAGVRGVDAARVLEFTGGGVKLAVELVHRQVMGQLTGQGVTEVAFESADGRVRSVAPDKSGFFTLDGEDHGLVRFSVEAAERRHVTEWFVL